jgi:hypothetical protein
VTDIDNMCTENGITQHTSEKDRASAASDRY